MNKKFRQKITAVICIFSFLAYTSPAFASDTDFDSQLKKGVVTQIKLGEKAPFDGILLSTDAAAKLYGELNFFEKECKLTLSKELSLAEAKYQTDIDFLKLRLEIESDRTQKLIQIKNERIQFLEENWKPQPWYETGEFWLAIGLVSGVLITVGAGYAIGQAGK